MFSLPDTLGMARENIITARVNDDEFAMLEERIVE